MNSTERINDCIELIEALLTVRKEQEEVDKIYEKMVNMYRNELSQFLKEVKPTQKSKRAIHHRKNRTGRNT